MTDTLFKNYDEAVTLISELQKALSKVLTVGVQITEGPYQPKNNKCKHGQYGYNGCEQCVDDFLQLYLEKTNKFLEKIVVN